MYRQLLVPLDGSAFAEQALPLAGAILRRNEATLTLVRVHRPIVYDTELGAPRWDIDQRDLESEYLARVAARMHEAFGVAVSTALLEEPVVGAICAYAADRAADLVIMSTHGRTGFSRAWMGSVADGVVRQAAVPVLLLRPDDESSVWDLPDNADRQFERLLLPLDGSRLSEAIVGHTVRLARAFESEIVLLRVIEPVVTSAPEYPISYPVPVTLIDGKATDQVMDAARAYLSGKAAHLRHLHGLRVTVDVKLYEHAAPAIIDAAKAHDADLIAMSTHGRGASRLFVGSVADKVIRGGPRAVLLYRPNQD